MIRMWLLRKSRPSKRQKRWSIRSIKSVNAAACKGSGCCTNKRYTTRKNKTRYCHVPLLPMSSETRAETTRSGGIFFKS